MFFSFQFFFCFHFHFLSTFSIFLGCVLASLKEALSVRWLVGLSVGPYICNAFIKFDEITFFLNDLKCREHRGGRSDGEAGVKSRKERQGGKSDEERATRRVKK